jgi:predicted alpha/beta hydrolase
MPQLDQDLPARDGVPLAATIFTPDAAPHAVVQINSATGAPRQYYRRFAAWLAGQGFEVVTFDYRGVGGSLRGDIREASGHVRDWAEQDAAGVLDAITARRPGLPVHVVGHSIGGQLVGLCDNNAAYASFVGVAAQSGYWKLWDEPRREQLRQNLFEIEPALIEEHGYLPGSRLGMADLPAGIARSWNHWRRSRDYVVDDAGRALREHFHAFRAPMTFLRFPDDPTAPAAHVQALMSFYAHAPRRELVIDPAAEGLDEIGHFGFFREGCAKLWPRVVEAFSSTPVCHPG